MFKTFFTSHYAWTIISAFLLGGLYASGAEAGKYRQPAYVTNAYFTDNVTNLDGTIKPGTIINVIRAGYSRTSGYMVLDLIADKGTHHFSVELLDHSGNKFQNHNFPPAVSVEDNFVINLNLNYGGNLPENGIFFKLYDQFGSKKKTLIGTYRILSNKW